LAFEKEGIVSKTEMRRYGLSLHKIIHQLERKALSLGFPFATGLIGGSCKLCRKCVGPAGPCRISLMARPSIEGMGIDGFRRLKRLESPLTSLPIIALFGLDYF
jgi:predicted metal-binding protein